MLWVGTVLGVIAALLFAGAAGCTGGPSTPTPSTTTEAPSPQRSAFEKEIENYLGARGDVVSVSRSADEENLELMTVEMAEDTAAEPVAEMVSELRTAVEDSAAAYKQEECTDVRCPYELVLRWTLKGTQIVFRASAIEFEPDDGIHDYQGVGDPATALAVVDRLAGQMSEATVTGQQVRITREVDAGEAIPVEVPEAKPDGMGKVSYAEEFVSGCAEVSLLYGEGPVNLGAFATAVAAARDLGWEYLDVYSNAGKMTYRLRFGDPTARIPWELKTRAGGGPSDPYYLGRAVNGIVPVLRVLDDCSSTDEVHFLSHPKTSDFSYSYTCASGRLDVEEDAPGNTDKDRENAEVLLSWARLRLKEVKDDACPHLPATCALPRSRGRASVKE
ncbi:hypothetical protein BW737_005635 [Actinomyces ruminis]|uniref:Lipoprotein n=1 Tax=Actinomyces ruminis TaxID=1937003 RepID=A0ABX4MBX3_9ACTO|nr:hypothetical protein BW737_005635 [Actinomyces ruminis]